MSEKQCFVVFRLTETGDGVDIVSVHEDHEDAQSRAKQTELWEGTKIVLVRSTSLYLKA